MKSPHVIRAKDVHIGINKDKIMLVLHSSKTHSKADKPQIIKIMSNYTSKKDQQCRAIHGPWCPFKLLREFMSLRKIRESDMEQFFVFFDGSPVLGSNLRAILHRCPLKLQFNPALHGLHGLRSGHASDLLKAGISVETIKKIGRWKSNAVYKYLKLL